MLLITPDKTRGIHFPLAWSRFSASRAAERWYVPVRRPVYVNGLPWLFYHHVHVTFLDSSRLCDLLGNPTFFFFEKLSVFALLAFHRELEDPAAVGLTPTHSLASDELAFLCTEPFICVKLTQTDWKRNLLPTLLTCITCGLPEWGPAWDGLRCDLALNGKLCVTLYIHLLFLSKEKW